MLTDAEELARWGDGESSFQTGRKRGQPGTEQGQEAKEREEGRRAVS